MIGLGDRVLYHGRARRGGPRRWLSCEVVNVLERSGPRTPSIVLAVPGRTRPLVLPESVVLASSDCAVQPSLLGGSR